MDPFHKHLPSISCELYLTRPQTAFILIYFDLKIVKNLQPKYVSKLGADWKNRQSAVFMKISSGMYF